MLKCISINSLSTRQNIRENVVNDKEFAQLCDSIKANGLLSPLTVREIDNNKYEIIAGHRRYEALKAIGEAMVECNVVDMFETENEIIRAQLLENVHRKNITSFEYVKVFDKLKENYNMSNGQLALYLNKSLSWVNVSTLQWIFLRINMVMKRTSQKKFVRKRQVLSSHISNMERKKKKLRNPEMDFTLRSNVIFIRSHVQIMNSKMNLSNFLKNTI